MDSVTIWLNSAGKRAISSELTFELCLQLAKEKRGTKKYTKILNRICEGNLLLLYKTAKSCSDKRLLVWGTDLSVDLLQAGYFGLHLAAERYDTTRGTRFSTCAVPWIRQRLSRHLVKNEARIYVPERIMMEIYYRKTHDGQPSGKPGAPKSNSRILAAEVASSHFLALDRPVNPRDPYTCLGDFVSAPDSSERTALIECASETCKTIMDKAGIDPKVQKLMISYSERGVMSMAALDVGIPTNKAGKLYREAIKKCQDLV